MIRQVRTALLLLLFTGCALEDSMPLPSSRNTTYAPGSQVKSVDLNAIQDELVAKHGLLTGTIPGSVTVDGTVTADAFTTAGAVTAASVAVGGSVTVGNTLTVNANVVSTGGDLKFQSPRARIYPATLGVEDGAASNWLEIAGGGINHVVNAGTTGDWDIPITVESGERITVKVTVKTATAQAGSITAVLRRATGSAASTNVGSISNNSSTADDVLTIVSAHVVVTSARYWVQVQNTGVGGAFNRFVYEVAVEYTREP